MNTILTVLLTMLCFSIPVGILVIAAIWGTRSRLQYANRIREAQAKEAFADMSTPENKTRFRRLAIFALIGVLGMALAIAVLVLQMATKFSGLYGVTIVIALIFGATGATAGLLMQREINRRL